MYIYSIFFVVWLSTNRKTKNIQFVGIIKINKVIQLLEDKNFFDKSLKEIKNKQHPNIYVLCNFYHSALDNKLKYLNLYFIINEFF